jgi:hypothetical protein
LDMDRFSKFLYQFIQKIKIRLMSFISALSNLVANRHMWRQAILMWRQPLFFHFHILGCSLLSTLIVLLKHDPSASFHSRIN